MHDIFPESIWYLQLVHQISASYEVWNPEKKLVTYAHTYAHALHYYIDGIPDWVIEEDVFADNKALWWSPDGSKLVYGVFNDTLVNTVDLPLYGNWHNGLINRQGYPFLQYPLKEVIHYPKAGTTNPTFALWYADVGLPGNFKVDT